MSRSLRYYTDEHYDFIRRNCPTFEGEINLMLNLETFEIEEYKEEGYIILVTLSKNGDLVLYYLNRNEEQINQIFDVIETLVFWSPDDIVNTKDFGIFCDNICLNYKNNYQKEF